MFRRTFIAISVVSIAMGAAALHLALPAQAEVSRFTNISAAVSGNSVNFYACVIAPSAPTTAIVTLQGGQTVYLSYDGQSCGSGTYFVTGGASLAAGTYYFQTACGLTTTDAIPCLQRGIGLATNFQGLAVENQCQVDFSVPGNLPAQNCSGPGVAGSLIVTTVFPTFMPQPSSSNTPIPPTATSTSTPPPNLPADTPAPQSGAKSSSTPSATVGPGGAAPSPTSSGSGNAGPGGYTAVTASALTPTPIPQPVIIIGSGSTEPGSVAVGSITSTNRSASTSGALRHNATNALTISSSHSMARQKPNSKALGASHPATAPVELHVDVRSPLVRPGGIARLVVTFAKNALILAGVELPGQPNLLMSNVTDDAGKLMLAFEVPPGIALQQGRATARISVTALAGAWQHVASIEQLLRPGARASFTIVASPGANVRATVIYPGRRPLTYFGTASSTGRYDINLVVPGMKSQASNQNPTRVVVQALSPVRRARASVSVIVSDMVLWSAAGQIVNCAQTQDIHVEYRPNAPILLAFQFAHGRRIALTTRTDDSGDAAATVQLTFVRAHSPVRFRALVSDLTPGVHRAENLGVQVALPLDCQQTPSIDVTIGP